MPMTEPAYFTAFKNFAFTRTRSGVLTLRFHTEGGPATFTGQMHTDFPRALYEIGEDLKGYPNIRFNYFETSVKDDQLEFSYQLKEGVSNDRIGYLILKREKVVEMLEKL